MRAGATGPARVRFHSPLWAGFAPALLALAGLVLLDTRDDLVITGFFALVPLATALSGDTRVTVAVSVLTITIVAVSGVWNDSFATDGYWVRLALVAAACLFSSLVAGTVDRSVRTARRLELLDDVAASAGGDPSLAGTLQRITELAVPELADICLVDAISGGRVERLAVRATGPRHDEIEAALAAREPTLPPEVSTAGAVTTEPVLKRFVNDRDLEAMAHSEPDLELLRSLGIRSFVSTPLRSRGRQIGVLTLIQAGSGRRHGAEDARFSRVLADRVALTLDNAGLFSDLESVEMRMDTVMAVLDEPVTITDRAGKLIFANRAAVELAGRETLEALLEPQRELPGFDVYDEEGLLIARNRLPWEVDLPAGAPIVRLVHPTGGEESWLRVRSRGIEGPDERPLYTVAAYEDVTEMKLAEFAQSVFASTAELLAESTDPEGILERLAHLLIPRLADACAILMPSREGTLSPTAVAHVDPNRETQLRALIDGVALNRDAPGVPEMLESPEPVVFEAGAAEGWPAGAVALAEGLDSLGLGSVMGQPLRIGTKLIGLIGFANRADRRPFTALEQRIALGISERAALAIENARVASERSEIADTLQKGLRPSVLPTIPGWSLAALYAPAGAENEAGGDFYDLLRIEGGWMVVIGDVTGHGARAASLTALARYTLRTASVLTNDPRRALAELNRALLQRPGGALCSVAALTLDQPARGEIRVALAGHPPPLVVHGGSMREVRPAGPVLGAFEDSDWEIETLALDPGDQLVVYTDGVIEARGDSGRFGEDRLCRCIGDVRDPADAIGRIRSELEGFAGEALDDDAAALAVRLDWPGPALGTGGAEASERADTEDGRAVSAS